MGECAGRDKDIVMTRGNKGIRARSRTVVEHGVVQGSNVAGVINAVQCGGVLNPDPALCTRRSGPSWPTLPPSHHSFCNTTPLIPASKPGAFAQSLNWGVSRLDHTRTIHGPYTIQFHTWAVTVTHMLHSSRILICLVMCQKFLPAFALGSL